MRSEPLTPSSTATWPPPPHDPRERAIATVVCGWEVRVFPPEDGKHHFFATRGFLHVQLWHPTARVSVLTPSRLTGGHFEIFPYEGWKMPVRNPRLVRGLVARAHRVALPPLPRIDAIIEWFVRAAERRACGPAPQQRDRLVETPVAVAEDRDTGRVMPPPQRRRS